MMHYGLSLYNTLSWVELYSKKYQEKFKFYSIVILQKNWALYVA